MALFNSFFTSNIITASNTNLASDHRPFRLLPGFMLDFFEMMKFPTSHHFNFEV